MKRLTLICAVAIGVLLIATGCSHTTTISAGQGAKIYVDGVAKGEGTANVDVGNGLGGSFKVKVEKEGSEPLVADVSRGPIAWMPLGGAIGGCLGGACVGGGVGAVVAVVSQGIGFLAIPCCALLGGVPFLALVLWMNQAPDKVDVDLAARTVKTTPSVDVKIAGAAPAAADKPGDKPIDKPDQPIDKPGDHKPEQPDKPVVQPFDY